MPFVLLLLGLLFLVVAVRGTQTDFFSLVKSEFTGTNNFLVWVLAIVILGMIGYLKPIRPVAHAMIGLVILVMIIANKGIFANFNQAIRNPAATPAATTGTGATAPAGTTAPAQPAASTSPTGGLMGWIQGNLGNEISGQQSTGVSNSQALMLAGV